MTSGIYMIKNKKTGQMYVGQSKHIKRRWVDHKYELNLGIHANTFLQNSWNKYGKDNFSFSILEEVNEDDLNKQEKYWIAYYDTFNDSKHYNLTSGGDSPEYTLDLRIERSKNSNQTGIFGLYKFKSPNTKAGFTWRYCYNDDGEYIYFSDRNFIDLKKKVLEANCPWIILDENLAKDSFKENQELMKKYPKGNNQTGFYRVYFSKDKYISRDGVWVYGYSESGKHNVISDADLLNLEKKIKEKGLPWRIIDENLANESLEKNREIMLNFPKKNINTTGFYRVSKLKNDNYVQGFGWKYTFGKNQILSVDLTELEQKILELGFEWKITDEELAKKSLEENEQNILETFENKSPTGIINVTKVENFNYTQGFVWRYTYRENGKPRSLASIDLTFLKEKVLTKGLSWTISNEELATNSFEENEQILNEFSDQTNINKTGILGVSKRKINNNDYWTYGRLINGKQVQFTNKSLFELKNKVISENLPWDIVNKKLVDETLKNEEKKYENDPKRNSGIEGVKKVSPHTNLEYWVYEKIINNEKISFSALTLSSLKKIVQDNGFPWDIIDPNLEKKNLQVDKKIKKEKLNKTGILNVDKRNKKGIISWTYRKTINKKVNQFSSYDLLKLKEKVLDANMDWIVYDTDLAKKSFDENKSYLVKSRKSQNKSGILGVRTKTVNNNEYWVYSRTFNGKNKYFSSKNLLDLKNSVEAENLPWEIIDANLVKLSLEKNISMNSESSNDGTGFLGVRKRIRNNKLTWRYSKTVKGEKLDVTSKDLLDLEQKVVSKGFPWKIVDEKLASKSLEENNNY